MSIDSERPGVPAALLLAFLSLIPLSGVGFFAVRSINTAAESVRDVDGIVSAAPDAVTVGRLRTALLDERNWALANDGIEELGLPIGTAEQLLGIKFRQELADSIEETDVLVVAANQPQLEGPLASVRALDEKTEVLVDEYAKLTDEMDAKAEVEFQQLLDRAANLPNGEEVTRLVMIVRAAGDARAMVSELQTNIFGIEFGLGIGHNEQFMFLISNNEGYQLAMDTLRTLPAEGSRSTLAVKAVVADPLVKTFSSRLSEAISDAIADRTGGTEVDLSNLATIIESTTVTWNAAIGAAVAHDQLLAEVELDLADVGLRLAKATQRLVCI